MQTIKSREEISLLFSQGKRVHTPYFTLIVLPVKQHGQHGRVAFIAGKKLGNAVWRNSAKRRMREVCRACNGPLEAFDVIFLAKKPLMQASYSKVLAQCDKVLKNQENW